jgi:hypothetical protein
MVDEDAAQGSELGLDTVESGTVRRGAGRWNEGGQAWFGSARHSGGDRTATNRLALHISDLTPSGGVLMTTYHVRA